MATFELIDYTPHRCNVVDERLQWALVENGKVVVGLPQIFWADGTSWREANMWAMERATSKDASLDTVVSNMRALHAYAKWLERAGTNWWDFPVRKADRCLDRYRGVLIDARDAGEIAPSSATQRMAATVRFYRWLHASGLILPDGPMWTERTVGIHLIDPVGFNRTITVSSTNLAIKNRKAPKDVLEDGLLPVSANHRTAILEFAKEHASEELLLMLTSGFFTGMRLGTLTDLKLQTLERAAPDPAGSSLWRLAVGPGADPPVHTKGGVTGHIRIMQAHLDALREYFFSTRRLKREAQAAPEHRNLLFLTSFGNPYARRGSDRSSAINVEMHSLRTLATSPAMDVLRHFKFHQTRCTFATELARLAIAAGGAINALAIVKEFLLHSREATSMKYIKFVEKTPAKEEAANAFTREFLGVVADCREVPNG